ncbi:MAG TPA: AMP-binding protein [Phycisphaerae bacterium]|nr:AMP-binding protein [Phycisphaerae bacterium]
MLVETLLQSAMLRGDKPAVADPSRSLTYRQLAGLSIIMRGHVEQATQRPHVGILLPSTTAFAGTFYGALWAGKTVVPLNFMLQPAELAAIVQDAELDVIFATKFFRELAGALPCKVVYVEDLPLQEQLVALAQAAAAAGGVPQLPSMPSVGTDDTAVLLYTSGTSGKPKGVCQTYGNLRSDMEACVEKAQLKEEHHFLGLLPLFHSFGLTAMLLVPVRLGASVFYMPRFLPAAVIDAIREQKVSVTMMIASMYTALLRVKSAGPEDMRSVKYILAGGEALPDAVFEAFRDRFGVEVLQGYGMSEAAPVVSLNTPWAHKVGTVGQAIPGVTVAAFDDAGHQLGANQIGELWVKGPIVMKGYYKKPEETAAALTPDGWYKSGDMGTVDAEGFIKITGRKKEMIIVGGENVYPREIEAVLEQHPAVSESAVIGQHDPSRGEVVVAFVTLNEGASATDIELREFCRDKIAGYKIPRRVIISSELPRGPTGKILKRKLHELL